jgi:D-amino-acid dehydrogenase
MAGTAPGKHAIIIGAGVTGLATALYLVRAGHRVTVIDHNNGPGQGASYANGAQLSYSYVAPLAGPGVLPKVPPWLLRRDAPLRFRPSLDLDQWRWLLAFVRACNRETSRLTTRRLLTLSFHSRRLMHAFVASAEGRQIPFGYATNGKLVVYCDQKDFEGASAGLDYQRSLGCAQHALDAAAVRALEPALAEPTSGLGQRMVGAIHTPSEEVGDCYRFCVGLEQLLTSQGVTFLYDRTVTTLVRRGSQGPVVAVATATGEIAADCVILASGTASPALARPLGLRLPVYPLKGYSITLPASSKAPTISVTDFKRKIVYAPLTSPGPDRRNEPVRQLRIAGMADIVGNNRSIDPERLSQLITQARAAFPLASTNDYARDGLAAWAGLRPATPRGTPVLGATPVANLYLNIGQGALGWTLALGSGQVVADIVSGRTPEIELDGFGLAD